MERQNPAKQNLIPYDPTFSKTWTFLKRIHIMQEMYSNYYQALCSSIVILGCTNNQLASFHLSERQILIIILQFERKFLFVQDPTSCKPTVVPGAYSQP
jgi:hypothetical protein